MTTAATAALIVAIGLLVLAAAACAVQMTPVKDARARRLAHLYLDPLATWCLAAVVVHALAVVAAGDLVALKLVLPIGIGIAAFLLRWADEPDAAPAQERAASPAPAPAPSGASPRTAAASARPGTPAPARAAAPTPAAVTPRAATPAPPAAPVRPATGSLWSRHSA